MSTPIDEESAIFREVPIAAPADRAAYRQYRLDQVQRELPANASDELREWIVAIEVKRLEREQGAA